MRSRVSGLRDRLRRTGPGVDIVTAQASFGQQQSLAMRAQGAFPMLLKKRFFCNICCMAKPQPKSSPLDELCSAQHFAEKG
jgi:hypothetical protein